MTRALVGVDLGGTDIKAGLLLDGKLVESLSTPTPAAEGPEAVLDAVAALVRRLITEPEAVGFAIPGEIDGEGRCWDLPNVPGFTGVLIPEELRRRLGCPVVVENDATAAALAELRLGVGVTYRSFLLVTLGTGIGGGLVLDGHLRRGKQGFAGEFGHLMIDRRADAPSCACGRRGCVEAFASTAAVLRSAAERGLEVCSMRDLASLALAAEPRALASFAAMGDALGDAAACAQNLLDLDAIIFAGGISASFSLIEPGLRAALRRRAFGPPVAEVPLLVSKMGSQAGIVGAALLTTL